MDDAQLAETWIRYQHKAKPRDDDPDFEAVEAFFSLLDDDPEHLYRLLEVVVQASDDEEVLSMVGAGPLEDLLCYHGEEFVDRVLVRARQDRSWRFALGNVWISRAKSRAVREQVEAAQKLYFGKGDSA